jgi:hypothetical protein
MFGYDEKNLCFISNISLNGLPNFRYRADELKGIFSIHPAINEGAKIQLSFKIT